MIPAHQPLPVPIFRRWLRRVAREQRAGCWIVYCPDPLIARVIVTSFARHQFTNRTRVLVTGDMYLVEFVPDAFPT